MNAQHSPGPWSHNPPRSGAGEYIRDATGKPIAWPIAAGLPIGTDEADANARLMSLAPEMFEAVEQASRLHPHLVLCQCTEVEPCYPRLLVTLLAKVSAS